MKKLLTLIILFLTGFNVFSQAQTPFIFFDDFARYDNRLDTTKWEPGSSVFLNNQLSKAPVSKNIVSFNGFSANGILNQYTGTGNFDVDTLTSKPVNLVGFNPADSVYLSFYLQTGVITGAGVPNSASFFRVEFKDINGNWQQVFSRNGTAANRVPDFTNFFLAVKNQVYFHTNFQFRFFTTGRIDKNNDTWNLDYVVLGANRQKNKSEWDVMTSRYVSPLLERYTAMPIHQFMANVVGELNDTIYTTFNNYENLPRGVTSFTTIKIGSNSPATIGVDTFPLFPNIRQYREFNNKPNPGLFNGLSGFQDITSSVYINYEERNPDTKANDTISRVTHLHNYYAYDDGSPENSINLNANAPRQIAYKFHANVQDQVSAISVYLPKFKNTKNNQVTFRVWNANASGQPDGQGTVFSTFATPDIALLDNWFTITPTAPVPVNGDFFIGWQIANNRPEFHIGLDLNNSPSYNVLENGIWQVVNQGALMLRPVMNNNITGLSGNLVIKSFKVYPNPANNYVNVQGRFKQAILLNATGQQVFIRKATGEETRLELGDLPAGLYLLQLQTEKVVETHKLIIR